MRKELSIHFISFIVLFVVVTVLRGWFNIIYLLFWVGGIVGTIGPDIDHLIYIYFLRPQELTSQRVTYMLSKRDVGGSLNLLATTRSERKDLIFHTILFQLIFLVLTFLILSSKGSLLARGIVLAFSLHLIVDQIVDFRALGNINNWFKNLPMILGLKEQKYYIWAGVGVIMIFAILF